MAKLTPQEVRRTVAQDFKRFGISQEMAAEVLGYSNKQTVANILTSKKDFYMPPEQAKRFADGFGYDIRSLMTGEGPLVFDPPEKGKFFSIRNVAISDARTDGKVGILPEDEVALLDQYLQVVCRVFGDARALKLYGNYKTMIHGRTGAVLAGGLTMNTHLVLDMLTEMCSSEADAADKHV